MRLILILAFGVAPLLAASSAFASGNHHSAPMGGRSALMGGTGVALGVDGAAPFLNPATIANIQRGKLAFSARFYRLTTTTVKNFYTPGPIDAQFGSGSIGATDEVNHGLHSVPDSVCYFLPPFGGVARKHRLSLCLTTLEEQELSFRALGMSRTTPEAQLDLNQHFEVNWSRFNAGPTWGAALTDRLTVGASFLVSFSRYRQATLASSVIEANGGAAATSSYESLIGAASWDVATRIGAGYRLSQRFTVGASATLPLFHVLGTFRQTRTADLNGAHDQSWSKGDFRAAPPIEFRAGLGGEWESFRFEADTFLTLGSASYVRGELDTTQTSVAIGAPATRTASSARVNERSRTVLNLALGAEVFASPRFSVLFGAQSDFNALQQLAPEAGDARLFRTRLNYYRTGVGICSYTDYGDLMFGLRFDYGAGKAEPPNTLAVPTRLGLVDVHELGLMAVLAGSLSWHSIRQTVDELGNVVQGNSPAPPKALPAPLSAPKRKD